MRIRRPLAGATTAIVTVVASALVLVGCSSTPQADKPEVPTPPAAWAEASSTDLLRGRVLPLFVYRDDTSDSMYALDRAVAIVKNACLARYGFPPGPVPTAPLAMPPMYRVFGLTDPAVAAKYGYHLDPVGVLPEDSSPPQSDSLRLVLLGEAPGFEIPNPDNPVPGPTHTYQGKVVPPFGCQGEAVQAVKLPGVTEEERALAGNLSTEAWGRAVADRRMTEVTARFGACMKAKGFKGEYSGPYGPFEDFDIGKPLTSKEIATAVADVDCKRDTKLVDTWFEVEKEYEDVLIQENIETLTKVKTALDAAVANALKIAGNGG